MYTNAKLVNLAILRDAAEDANKEFHQDERLKALTQTVKPIRAGTRFDPKRRQRIRFAAGEIYRADPERSKRGGLCLSIDRSIIDGIDEDLLERIHQIGRNAVQRALIKNQKIFIGMVLGEARAGRNYFKGFR